MKSKFTYTTNNQTGNQGESWCTHEIIVGEFTEHLALQHIELYTDKAVDCHLLRLKFHSAEVTGSKTACQKNQINHYHF